MISICVLVGTARAGRQSQKVARLVMDELTNIQGLQCELADLGEMNLPVMRYRLAEMDNPPPDLVGLSSMLSHADGVVMVVPEYKRGYPGSLKNAFDYLRAGILRYKPIAIVTVSSGGLGGVNCLAQLRPICLALGGLPIPNFLPISHVQDHFDENGALTNPRLRDKLNPFINEFLWYTEALSKHKQTTGRS